ncbi:MAG: Fur family transcriptional regulator, ferric uptake regulator [Clostridiales bacterium]|nr:Fur family transcriptional regulator, ferric uptake regulator [Clostridiales bacterium]
MKKSGIKVTKNRKLVLSILEQSQTPLSAQDIYQKITCQKELDYSTVYRILSIFSEHQIVLKSIGGDSIAYYQLNQDQHGHYLVCSACHKRIVIDGCPLHAISEKLTAETGFHITGHNLEFIGECPDCFQKKEREPQK